VARYQKGQSGNPKGRPRGVANQAKLRAAILGDLPNIINALTEQAKAGDAQAAKLLMDRCLPALKPADTPVTLPLGDDLASSGRAVLEAVGAGKLTPEQGQRVLAGIGSVARVIETDELLRRVEALEEIQRGDSDKS